jgi:hypothetical protein
MEVPLTQDEKDTLRGNPDYKKYFIDSIMGDDAGGVAFLLRLTSMVDTVQAIAWVVARSIRKSPNIVGQDPILLDFMDVQINVRDIDKKEDSIVVPPTEVPGGDPIPPTEGEILLAQVIGYLNAANRITLLVGDYMANRGLVY